MKGTGIQITAYIIDDSSLEVKDHHESTGTSTADKVDDQNSDISSQESEIRVRTRSGALYKRFSAEAGRKHRRQYAVNAIRQGFPKAFGMVQLSAT